MGFIWSVIQLIIVVITSFSFVSSILFSQIEEVALVTDKVTKKRRGFCFVTYFSEDSVDKCTEQTFHTVEGTQVRDIIIWSTVCKENILHGANISAIAVSH